MDDANRAFIQAFFVRNVLSFEEAQTLLASIIAISEQKEVSSEDVSVQDFESMISAANSALSPLDYEIRSTFHQQSRVRYYALVNTTSDAMTQVATLHSADEIAYVKRLLDELFDVRNTERQESLCISGKDALNLVRSGRRETQSGPTSGSFNLSAHEAEVLLSKLVDEAWLEKSAKGFYTLSPRALMELKDWLVATYNEATDGSEEADEELDKIKFCQACKDIVTIGQRCARRDCRCRLHDTCVQNFFRIQKSRKCPQCQAEWDGKHFVGERAITTSESYLKGRRRSGARPFPGSDAIEEAEQSADNQAD